MCVCVSKFAGELCVCVCVCVCVNIQIFWGAYSPKISLINLNTQATGASSCLKLFLCQGFGGSLAKFLHFNSHRHLGRHFGKVWHGLSLPRMCFFTLEQYVCTVGFFLSD